MPIESTDVSVPRRCQFDSKYPGLGISSQTHAEETRLLKHLGLKLEHVL